MAEQQGHTVFDHLKAVDTHLDRAYTQLLEATEAPHTVNDKQRNALLDLAESVTEIIEKTKKAKERFEK